MAIDWSNIYKKNKGVWVSLEKDEKTIISSGKTAKEAWDKALRKWFNKPLLVKMPDRLISYVGSF